MIYETDTRTAAQCTCDIRNSWQTAGDICLDETKTRNAQLDASGTYALDKKIKYTSGDVANSDIMLQQYTKAAYLCKEKGIVQHCQALANLCVLQMYQKDKSACTLMNYMTT